VDGKAAFRSPVSLIPVLLVAAFLFAVPANAQIIFVDQHATGPTQDGTSWCSAFLDLQDALQVAVAGATIRVADGVYRPDQGAGQTQGSRTSSFVMKSGVILAGGYAGCGATSPDDRAIKFYETILSGDLSMDDGFDFANTSENAYQVVTAGAIDATGVLEGFTVTAGNANGGVARSDGGGMIVAGGSPTIRSCEFVKNQAGSGAGVMVACCGDGPVFTNCTFGENVGGSDGGGLYVKQMHATLVNCLFLNNIAGDDGGGIIVTTPSGSLDLSSCTFYHNTALGNGGGVYVTAGATASVTNSILWNNTDIDGIDSSAQVHLQNSSASVSFSCIQGGWAGPGSNNIAIDPLFVDPDGADNTIGTEDDDLRLSPGSPAIDAGDNLAVDVCQLDLDGNSRRQDDPATIDTGNGSIPVVDMGVYEFGSIPPQDCNSNGVPDECEIADGTSSDFNLNGVPDECEPDCQPNDIPDFVEIGLGLSEDCNLDEIPDDCQLVDNDCNADEIPDDCESNSDEDLIIDACDNCELVSNQNQADFDDDGSGDACDPDIDNDGVENALDVCDYTALGAVVDEEGRSLGDIDLDCDTDLDDFKLFQRGFTGAGMP